MTYKTLGIIIKRTNLGEADRILTILTNKFGKIRVVAKGVRKTLSKLAGHLEPFCLTDLMITEGRNLDIVSGAMSQKTFLNLRDDLRKTHAACYLAEIIEQMLPEGEKHEEIFNLLVESLESLNSEPSELILAYFELNLLKMTGYKPELYRCSRCDKEIQPGRNYFHLAEGGLTCVDCGGSIKISDQAIKAMRLLINEHLLTIKKIKTDLKLVREISNISSQYIKYINQKEFKAERFARSA